LKDGLGDDDRQRGFEECESAAERPHDGQDKDQSNNRHQNRQPEHHANGKSKYGQRNGGVSHHNFPVIRKPRASM
jgi:hypothetical protein